MNDPQGKNRARGAWILGVCLLLGLLGLAAILGSSLVRFKHLDRTVVVKGLSEREVDADVAIWPADLLRSQ